MKESVAIAKEANRKQGSSPTRSNSIQRLRNGPERQIGSLRSVVGNIRRNGGVPSVENIATELVVMPSTDRASALLALQQTHGNQYVQRVVTGIQAKLKIGQPGDIYEQEADRVAEQVMQMPEPQVQRQVEPEEEEEEEAIQTELNGSIQRQPEEEEEEEPITSRVREKLTMGSPGDVYEQEADRVAEAISTEGGLSDLSNMNSIQQKLLSSLDPRALGGFTERAIKPMVSTDTVGSKKLSVNRKQEIPPQGDGSVPASIESRILQSKGKGNPLPQHMQNSMAIQAGYDFSNVRVKADSEAAELNSALGARAFTNGSDIWLGRGERVTDVKLMAHELTHVVQQEGARRIQPQSNSLSSILASKGFMPKFIQTLIKDPKINSTLFQKDILQFAKENSSERMTASQSKILENSQSGMSNLRENAQTLRGCIAGCSGSSSTPSPSYCCCCVDNLKISNIKKIDNATHMGHSFDTAIDLSYAKKNDLKTNKSCTLEWWEKTNVPYVVGQKANVWTDMTKNPSTKPSFDKTWGARKEPCPGKETIVDTDPPSLGKRPGRTVTRKLEFNIVTKSGQGCTCKNKSLNKKAEQVLTMVNAKPNWKKSHFKVL